MQTILNRCGAALLMALGALPAYAGVASSVPAKIAASALINNSVAAAGSPLTYSTQVPLSAGGTYYVYVKVQPGAFNGVPNAAAVFTSSNAALQTALQGATAASLSADGSFAVYTLAALSTTVPVDAAITFAPQGIAGNDGSIDDLAALVNGGVVSAQISIGSRASTATVLADIDSAAGGNIIIFEGQPVPVNACNIALQTGYWWNPAEPGRGYFLEQQANTIYFAAFMYAASGRATWYQASGQLVATGAATGPVCTFTDALYAYANGQTLSGPYVAPTIPTVVGGVTISFLDAAHATAQWPGATVNIQRYPIVAGGLGSGPSAAQPQTGFWWNPAEAGRGYGLEIQANTVYYAAFMYDGSGNPIWYLAGPGAVSAQGTYMGALAQYANGQTLSGSFQSPVVANASVGSTTLQFSSPASGMMTLPNGTQIPLQRFSFLPAGISPTVSVTLAGDGSGTVTSNPAEMNCGTPCTEQYAQYALGTGVTLTATPASGSAFGGWNGACTGTGACVLTAGANLQVGATFTSAASNAVVVTVTGPGTVTSAPAAIRCTQTGGASCSGAYSNGVSVLLLAAPNVDGSTFGGWSGDCASAGTAATCTLSATRAFEVQALFYPATTIFAN
jgi:hypothetical protein